MCLRIYAFSVFAYVNIVLKPYGIYKLCFLLLEYHIISFYSGSTIFTCACLTAAEHSVNWLNRHWHNHSPPPTVRYQASQLTLLQIVSLQTPLYIRRPPMFLLIL